MRKDVYFVVLTIIFPIYAMRIKLSSAPLPYIPFAAPTVISTLKLPVWPVWSGAAAQVLEWMGQKSLARALIYRLGGRVVPMDLSQLSVSPFLLLVHHTHSFMPLDLLRLATNLVLPEGFPAHPHSGFDTVTYCIEGGLRHRDSEGVRMTYGEGDTQWMRAGRGVIHEEMWDTGNYWAFKKIEIFQLWSVLFYINIHWNQTYIRRVNLRGQSKNKPPLAKVLSSAETPIFNTRSGSRCKVICGELEFGDELVAVGPGQSIADSPICLTDISLLPNAQLSLSVASDTSAVIYIRRGSLQFRSTGEEAAATYEMNDLVSFAKSADMSSNAMQISLSSGSEGAEAFLLVGSPLNEPVVWSGPVVETTENNFKLSSYVFNAVNEANGFWAHTLSDNLWEEHVRKLGLQRMIATIKRLPLEMSSSTKNAEE